MRRKKGIRGEQESVRGRHEGRAFLAEERVGQSSREREGLCASEGDQVGDLGSWRERTTLIGMSCPPAKKQALSCISGWDAGTGSRQWSGGQKHS